MLSDSFGLVFGHTDTYLEKRKQVMVMKEWIVEYFLNRSLEQSSSNPPGHHRNSQHGSNICGTIVVVLFIAPDRRKSQFCPFIISCGTVL